MLNSSAGNNMWSSQSLAFPPEISLEDTEVTWIVLGIKFFPTHVHPPPQEEELKGIERGMVKVFKVGEMLWFRVVTEKETREKCHQRPMKITA